MLLKEVIVPVIGNLRVSLNPPAALRENAQNHDVCVSAKCYVKGSEKIKLSFLRVFRKSKFPKSHKVKLTVGTCRFFVMSTISGSCKYGKTS